MLHGLARDPGMGLANAGIEQPQKIINLRGGPHRGAGIAGGCFLLNGNDGAQAIDPIHRRPFQLAHKLPSIGRK